MKNPFSTDSVPEQKLVRNLFDLGRSSVFTTEFGQLYPFFLQEVIPGDTAKINATIGFRGMPTLFPLQTKIRCSMEFYYVRNRTLFDGWEDFIYKTKDIEAPWLKLNNSRAKQMISTGSLGDALGVPTSFASDSPVSVSYSFRAVQLQHRDGPTPTFSTDIDVYNNAIHQYILAQKRYECRDYNLANDSNSFANGVMSDELDFAIPDEFSSDSFLTTSTSSSRSSNCALCLVRFYDEDFDMCSFLSYAVPISISAEYSSGSAVLHYRIDTNSVYYQTFRENLQSVLDAEDTYRLFIFSYERSQDGKLGDNAPYFPLIPSSSSLIPQSFSSIVRTAGVTDATDDTFISSNPFVGNNPDIKLSALPFRAYEQVMNYYYRNDKNNPYVLNGEVQYNEFIPTHAAGADENVYDFHYRNWELDRFTSAVPSPQFGEAPLVGLTYNIKEGTATLNLEGSTIINDAGETIATDPSITVGVDSDGKIESIVDFTQDVPSANLRRLQSMMQSHTGISINDLRITNSFQRFLENTLAKGLRYRNQMRSHHHVSVDYPDIDVPQYIGGASGIIDTGQINNMSETGSVGLGDYIGTLQGGIQMQHDITHYCVEHGFIIGICSVSPIPSYPQSINKTLIKNHPFDYYLPEFGKIGYVPIHYSELMPLQTPEDGSVDDIFGYQKAWYDYMRAFDEVHGDFRISLKDFVLTRTFAERPELSESFTVLDPEQLNDVFLANNIATEYNSTARWLCRSNVSCKMKRQIPMIGTPSLE